MSPDPCALSINVNKVALVRNTRALGIPSVTRAAALCLQAGAQGITVHPRPDGRHIRFQDVFDLATVLKAFPRAEYNVEGNPFHNLMMMLRLLAERGQAPAQATFVPDDAGQATSDHGFDLARDGERLKPLIAECHGLGIRVSLFMDADTDAAARVIGQARALGADRVELYTEPYAAAWGKPEQAQVLACFAASARAAASAGLQINAGHDLNQDNLGDFLAAVPEVREVSIGHAFVADALDVGYAAAVKGYLARIDAVRPAHS